MLNLGQKVQTIDPAKTLLSENGVFEVISPQGEHFRVECRQGQSIVSLLSVNHPQTAWNLTKIQETQQEQQQFRAATAGGGYGSTGGGGPQQNY